MDIIKDSIRSIPHWPIESVIFRDITTLLLNPDAFKEACDRLYAQYKDKNIDKVVSIDARGFIFGAVLAYKLGLGVALVRKKGKLPPETIEKEYSLEYGSNVLEISKHALSKGEKVVIVDDLLATGGTVAASIELVEMLGGEVVECFFVVELPDLHGREKLKGYNITALTSFEGE
ncbi:adenine phosphoribosyltransferase [Thermodesulfobacteriota bacterium]